MSREELGQHDMNLKLKIMRYLWNIGYFVRPNFPLIRYNDIRREVEYTDIDVIAIKFDERFEKQLILCDCKTGSTAKNTERILILGGLIQYFQANKGLYIRDKIDEGKYIEIAQKINVEILSLEQLDIIEKSMKIESNNYYGTFSRDQSKQNIHFDRLKTFDKEQYEYLLVKNWFDLPHQKILNLVIICDSITNNNKYNSFTKTFLLSYALSILSTAILEFSRDVLYMKFEKREEVIKQNLLGGRLEYYEKKQLLESLYNFMKKEIATKSNKSYDVQKSIFINNLVPNYTKHLIDLVNRLCLDPSYAKNLPRIIDIITFEKILHNKTITRNTLSIDLAHQNNFNHVRDFILFCARSGIVDKETENIFINLIKSLSE